ncbi:MAG: DUF3179 domain-containing (seleno)protein, partial [Pseudomonadota bacterium]
MISAINSPSRALFFTSLMALVLLPIDRLTAENAAPLPDYVIEEYGAPPEIPQGPLSKDLQAAVEVAFVESMEQGSWADAQTRALAEISGSGDPRVVWIISDLMRFVTDRELNISLSTAASELLGKNLTGGNGWGTITDHLIAWDVPPPFDYLRVKRAIFTGILPGWDRIFVEGDIDWHLVSWGGVLIDDRAYDTTDDECNCIPAADNPEVSSAEDATWLDDDDIVFGVEVNGEFRAYPRQIMEVREMVNDTLGGRDLGIP